MKRIFLIALSILFLLSACNNEEKHAQELLTKADEFYSLNDFVSAKQLLDSLKASFPKEVAILREGLGLKRKIELKEQERNLVYADSILKARENEAETLKKNFLFEKDPEYDEIGKFISQQQMLEKNLQRSYLRTGVNERGEMYMASVYHGKAIGHTKIKVSKPDGQFTETMNIPRDGSTNYSFIDGGVTTEIVTYQNGKDNGVILFICDNYKEKLKIEYIGERNFNMQIREQDKKAMLEIRDLAVVLSDIEYFKKEIEKSKERIEYLTDKLQNKNEDNL